jgi:hypothetical protein
MAPSVPLSPTTFSRLQSHAVPLIDTIDSVITRLLDAYESKAGAPAASGGADGDNIRQFNPSAPPDLTHTKVLSLEFAGKEFERSQISWNGLLYAAVREARARTSSAAPFKSLMPVSFVEGVKTSDGYRPLPDIGISVQGQDANGAWRAVRQIAQGLGCHVKVTFAWREKEGASFPGVTGQFSIAAR